MTPAEELTIASRIVREYAADADPGVVVHPESWRWVNLTGPVIAAPLAEVFDREAAIAGERGHAHRQVLRLARVIRSQHEAMRGGEG